jgi:hypothetical protein
LFLLAANIVFFIFGNSYLSFSLSLSTRLWVSSRPPVVDVILFVSSEISMVFSSFVVDLFCS